MEKIVSKYQALVGVEILHHYLLDEGNRIFGGAQDLPPDRKQKKLAAYNVHDWLEITPDAATAATMQGAQLILKKTKTGFLIVTAVKNANIPSMPLEGLKFHFRLQTKSLEIATHTALPTVNWKDSQPVQYVFSNELSRNYRAPYPSLSLPPERYAATQSYQPGDVVISGTKQFVAVAPSTGQAPPAASFWRETDSTLSYATRRNLRSNPSLTPDVTLAQVSIQVKAGTNPFDLLTPLKAINLARVFQIHLEKR